jgi:hypothetical protein
MTGAIIFWDIRGGMAFRVSELLILRLEFYQGRNILESKTQGEGAWPTGSSVRAVRAPSRGVAFFFHWIRSSDPRL